MEREEELEIKQNREAAQRLALERGLTSTETRSDPSAQEDSTTNTTLRTPPPEQEITNVPELLPDQSTSEAASNADLSLGKDST